MLLAGAALPLARVILDPLGSLPGSEAGDVYKHAWPYWHMLAQLKDGTWPYTNYLNAPDGGLLLDVMVLPSLIMSPVFLLAGPVLATNLWVLASLFGVGAATYALCRHLCGSTIGALCAALLVQTSPYLLGYALTSGVHERLALWIFPLTVLGLLRIMEGRGGGWRWPALLAAGSLLAFSQCPTYGLFSGVLLLLMLPLLLVLARSAPRRRLPGLAAAYLGMGGMMALTYAVYSWFVLEPTFLAGIPQVRVLPTMGVAPPSIHLPKDVATLAMLFDPWTVQAYRPVQVDDELYRLVYIGWIPLAAMLAGAVVFWRRRSHLALAVLGVALVFLLLSLGREVAAIGSDRVLPNPLHYLVSYLVPFFGGIPPAWQMSGLFVALGAPAAAALVGALPSRKARLGLAGLLLLTALTERALVLPLPVVLDAAPARPSTAYNQVSGDGALVDIPRLFAGTMVSRGYMFLAQTRHHRPIPAAINLGIARLDDYLPVTRGTSPDWVQTARCLHHNKVRWIMVHRGWFKDPEQAQKCIGELTLRVGMPLVYGEDEVLFDLSGHSWDGVELGEDCPRTARTGRQKRGQTPPLDIYANGGTYKRALLEPFGRAVLEGS